MLPYTFHPIGIVRSPFVDRASAPRQPSADAEVSKKTGRIDLLPGHGYEDALDGLEDFALAWLIFVFHKNVEEGRGWRPKVQPPRSATKRGLFATRSPHRPNPVGISAVRIDRIEGLAIHVSNLDLLDGTPVLDLKPYVAYTDAHPAARAGWLAAPDPIAPWQVDFGSPAMAQLEWLQQHGVDLKPAIEAALKLGPRPHAYRRIRSHGPGMRLALKEWRVDFTIAGEAGASPAPDAPAMRRILVGRIASGYRDKQLADDPSLALHKAFSGRFANLDAFPAG